MRSFFLIVLVLLSVSQLSRSQESPLVISRNMMDPKSDQLPLADKNGWLFRRGHDSNWAKKEIAPGGWEKLKPMAISAKYADENGRVEGWFRITIRLDSSFNNMPVGLRISTWAACDLYLDGKRLWSFGSTGADGTPYAEHLPFNEAPLPVDIKPGADHLIAIHFVDDVVSFPSPRLKSQVAGLNFLIRLTGPNYNTTVLRRTKELAVFDTLWVVTAAVLSLLFCLLAIQNPREKNIRLMALTCAALTLFMIFGIASEGLFNVSYQGYFLLNIGSGLSFALLLGLIPLTIAGIFQRKISTLIRMTLLAGCLAGLAGNLFDLQPLLLSTVCMVVVICTYFVISSWKGLRGAQWAVVCGLACSLLLGFLFIIVSLSYAGKQVPNYYMYVTGFSLSFPLSMLVYVAVRFKEIINDVQKNAQQVIRLSAEKEQQAVNQQKTLEVEVKRQTAEIRTALDNLKATQSQLIQAEKMASLGELTAGIAHEIQNPLNFVNNFSELNRELIEELKSQKSSVQIEHNEQSELDILNDIAANEEKINYHGKRADAIVKGMLQHSRSSKGIKEPTDINALTDEYLRLSYHGLRAKDKSFNAKLETHFDSSIGRLDIIPQDIGRALLNIFNNAFYAVNEKQKQNGAGYEPAITVSTKKNDDSIEIKIADNGDGIPKNIIDKIFQPFFTTKPTGQGTGLGLSLSYDIITKGHGGELKVETEEGKGSVFIMLLNSGN